jgi:hypothetical protein
VKHHDTPKQRAALMASRQAYRELRALMALKGWRWSRYYGAWVPAK